MGRKPFAPEAEAEIARLQEAKRKALAVADERCKENVALRAALLKAAEKLQIYRAQTNGEYVGGMEYTALMRLIAAAVNPSSVEQSTPPTGVAPK